MVAEETGVRRYRRVFIEGVGAVNERMQCLDCGNVRYRGNQFDELGYNDEDAAVFEVVQHGDTVRHVVPCVSHGCKGILVSVSECMREIAEAFTACGFSINCAYGEANHVAETAVINVHFENIGLTKDVFDTLPNGFNALRNAHGIIYGVHWNDLTYGKGITHYERCLALEDALSELWAWITEVRDSGAWAVWQLAGKL